LGRGAEQGQGGSKGATRRESEVYERSEAVIRERKDHGETVETCFLSIDATDITVAESRGKMAYITLRFVSQLVSTTRDRQGH
jgi:predicted lipid-binding transport protein (Tim44 family)